MSSRFYYISSKQLAKWMIGGEILALCWLSEYRVYFCMAPEEKYLGNPDLGVILQQDLCFDSHIDSKIASARKLLGAIKSMLHDASIKGKTLTYTSLCRPILEYADVVWDPVCKQTINSLEKVQTNAVKLNS